MADEDRSFGMKNKMNDEFTSLSQWSQSVLSDMTLYEKDTEQRPLRRLNDLLFETHLYSRDASCFLGSV